MRWSVTAVAVLALGVPASAQPSDNAALAEQLFNQGRDLGKAGNWDAACPKFEASLRLDPALGTRLNLATCYEKVGKIASAWGEYKTATELADKTGDKKRRDFAKKQAAALEPRLPKLTITPPAKVPPGLVIKRDGETVDAGALGSALFVDPGAHTLTASAEGYLDATVQVTSVEKKGETVAIPELVAKPVEVVKPEPVVVKQPPSPPPLIVHEASRTRAHVGLGIAGGGVIALGIGTVFALKAHTTYGDAKTVCGGDLVCDNEADYAAAHGKISDARSQAMISTVAMIAGAAAVGVGVFLYVTTPHTTTSRETAFVPVIGDRDAGLAVVGRF